MVFLDGIVGPDTQPDNYTNSGTNNNGLTTPRHRRTMQSNYPASAEPFFPVDRPRTGSAILAHRAGFPTSRMKHAAATPARQHQGRT